MPTIYSGDVPSDLSITGGSNVRQNLGASGFEGRDLGVRTFELTYRTPTSGLGVCLMRTYQAMDFTNIAGATVGSSTPRVWFNVEKRTSPSGTGTDVLASDLQLTTSGNYTTSMNSAQSNADDWWYIHISNVSGTVNTVNITLTLKVH